MLVRAGQPFCSPPKQIYQILLEHTNWITQMGLWGGGGTHGKAATKQRLGWADHSFRHFLKLINHAGSSSPSFYPLICLFVFLCLSVFLTLPPTLLLFLWGFWGLFSFTSPLIKENFVPLIFSSFPHLSLWFFFSTQSSYFLPSDLAIWYVLCLLATKKDNEVCETSEWSLSVNKIAL